MADAIGSLARGGDPRRAAWRNLWLVGRWGVGAALALAVALLAAGTEAGGARIAGALAALRGEPEPPGPADPERAALHAEAVRLAQAVARLAADRDRLAARLDTLERSLDDVTGSIARIPERLAPPAPQAASAPPPAAEPPAAAAPAAPPNPVPPGFVLLEPALGLNRPPVTPEVSEAVWSNVPVPRPAPRPQALHTGTIPSHQQDASDEPQAQRRAQYGVDLGSAATLDGIRAIWTASRTKHAGLAALTPAVAARQNPQRPGGVQLRLIAGPLASATAAAQVCAALAAGRTPCQPAVYEGQPLALR